MGKSLDYARYLQLAVESQEMAEFAEKSFLPPSEIAHHSRQAAQYRALAQAAAPQQTRVINPLSNHSA